MVLVPDLMHIARLLAWIIANPFRTVSYPMTYITSYEVPWLVKVILLEPNEKSLLRADPCVVKRA